MVQRQNKILHWRRIACPPFLQCSVVCAGSCHVEKHIHCHMALRVGMRGYSYGLKYIFLAAFVCNDERKRNWRRPLFYLLLPVFFIMVFLCFPLPVAPPPSARPGQETSSTVKQKKRIRLVLPDATQENADGNP